jgi:hypothetical protein
MDKYNITLVAAECVHLVESVNGVGRKREGFIFQEQEILISFTQRTVIPCHNLISVIIHCSQLINVTEL